MSLENHHGSESPEPSVDALLAAALQAIVKVRYCWAVTNSEYGPRARPMGHVAHLPGADPWSMWFLTRGSSRKVADIRCNERVSLVFQHEPSDAYVALSVRAVLMCDPIKVRARWEEHYNTHFPTDIDRAGAVFFQLTADCLDLWIRGITPEPFGGMTTTLRRDATQYWRNTTC